MEAAAHRVARRSTEQDENDPYAPSDAHTTSNDARAVTGMIWRKGW